MQSQDRMYAVCSDALVAGEPWQVLRRHRRGEVGRDASDADAAEVRATAVLGHELGVEHPAATLRGRSSRP